MALTVEQLLDEFRRQMDDTSEPFLWSDDAIIQFIDLAQREFCRKTEVLTESQSFSALAANNGDVPIPSHVYRIKRAILDSNGAVLRLINLNEAVDQVYQDDYGAIGSLQWETQRGTPRAVILDYATGTIRLVPYPVVDDSITLYYSYLPKRQITASSASTEISDVEHQLAMLWYARALAYNDHDADVYDPKAADRMRIMFEERIAQFAADRKIGRRRAGTVRYGGY